MPWFSRRPETGPAALWQRQALVEGYEIVAGGEHHALVRGRGRDMPTLHVWDPRYVPARIARAGRRARRRVTVHVEHGLEGLERLRGYELAFVGELPADLDPIYAAPASFDAVDLRDVWGPSLRRLDATRVGRPVRLDTAAAALPPGATLGPRTLALRVEDPTVTDGQQLVTSDHLRHLALLTARRLTSWTDLAATLPSLVELVVFSAPRLDGHRITGLPPGMLALNFEACRRLGALPFLADVPDLRVLFLEDCGRIDTVGPLAACQQLGRFLAIGDTKFLDGDLHPLADRPVAPQVLLRNWRHYRPSAVWLEAVLPPWEPFDDFDSRGDLDEHWPDRRPTRDR